MLEKTSLSETWRMVAAAEAGEIQSYKIAKTRKLENTKSRMSYQVAFAKAGENLSLQQLEQSPEKSKAKL
ncbi:hypothetical protein [Desulforegula conservatrix]|uniref:hypothetical protein n=1 Tax=Desulforegula conservatrix TaxID=153026 RepID=UPI000406F571|nr:hypothetical protein [Desulforegula conservatrix]